MPSDQPIRVVLAEDGVLIREGIAGLLSRFGYDVVRTVGDAAALTSAVSAYRPDLVLTDVRMPPDFTDEGLRAAIALRTAYPDLAVLVLSQYIELTYAGELLDIGGDAGVGYLLKDRITDVTTFAEAVRRVAAGDTIVDPKVVQQLLRRRRDPLQRLSEREREVLALMAEGRSNAAIARTLVVSEAAVGKHITSIFTKLDLPPAEEDNRRVLAVLAYLRGQPPAGLASDRIGRNS
ncbi:response regulator transcription factor [Micromonospora sp. DR5-3]|uniref:response regulator n=1 Tax=unclassified Micromonospora TaxID=2617518 RepID=UPI0011D5EFAE|nr:MULTISPECIES: response regulator transcription factor [unclassified Micromonospora]MCW3816829.1 response regulator transcription factor [Micromonospora sp. DR5-3]TYC23729.1 response regulator transcription factor [Micromonospora sp. MP36]